MRYLADKYCQDQDTFITQFNFLSNIRSPKNHQNNPDYRFIYGYTQSTKLFYKPFYIKRFSHAQSS